MPLDQFFRKMGLTNDNFIKFLVKDFCSKCDQIHVAKLDQKFMLIPEYFVCWNANDTHRENAPQNKTQTHKKNVSMNIWVVSTLNQLFIRTRKFYI